VIYYRSAARCEGLGLPLLLRADADPRALRRHERLSEFATEVAHAGRFYYRLTDALAQQGVHTALGRQFSGSRAPGFSRAPSMGGRPGRPGRAGGVPAYLAERQTDGPLHSLISGEGGRAPPTSDLAAASPVASA